MDRYVPSPPSPSGPPLYFAKPEIQIAGREQILE
jgi:hypothetical protein